MNSPALEPGAGCGPQVQGRSATGTAVARVTPTSSRQAGSPSGPAGGPAGGPRGRSTAHLGAPAGRLRPALGPRRHHSGSPGPATAAGDRLYARLLFLFHAGWLSLPKTTTAAGEPRSLSRLQRSAQPGRRSRAPAFPRWPSHKLQPAPPTSGSVWRRPHAAQAHCTGQRAKAEAPGGDGIGQGGAGRGGSRRFREGRGGAEEWGKGGRNARVLPGLRGPGWL